MFIASAVQHSNLRLDVLFVPAELQVILFCVQVARYLETYLIYENKPADALMVSADP